MDESKKVSIEVPAEGGEPPEEKPKSQIPKGDELKEPVELSEEDQALKDSLELAVTRTGDAEAGVVKMALELLRKEIREATSSMTSVPKPLKFLTPHYDTLVANYEAMAEGDNKILMSDILSLLSMTRTASGKREMLKYKLSGNRKELASWGHEYVRSLAGEIGQDYEHRKLQDPPLPVDELLSLVHDIVPFHFEHNAEPEAIDLLMETEQVGTLASSGLVNAENHAAVCLYMIRCADYVGDHDEEKQLLDVALGLYKAHGKLCDALRVALRINNNEVVSELLEGCTDEAVKKQMAYILARQHTAIVEADDEDVGEIMGNLTLSETFASLAKELDVVEPKTPEQIYKSHLSETGSTAVHDGGKQVESARGNLASTFVNAFVNAGFCKDALVTPEDSKWVFKHKGDGQISAAAAHGMLVMWSIDNLTDLDDLLEDKNDDVKAGALLGIGVACAGVRSEVEPALNVIGEYLNGDKPATHNMKMAGILGLGLAYTGTADESVMEYLSPFVADDSEGANMELVCMAGLALGMVYVGSADDTVGAILADRLMEATDTERNQSIARLLCLGLGLVFLRTQEAVATVEEVVGCIEHPIALFAKMVLRICAFAGTGNVLEVQRLLHKCAEHPTQPAEDAADGESKEKAAAESSDISPAKHEGFVQSAAVLGIALVTMGDELATDMASRTADHLLQYGDPAVRRMVPLSLALHHLSNPEYTIVDTLSKLSHDQDVQVGQNAILALGLIGAGTNNSRIAGLLRQLVVFYKKEADHLFCVRVAQGLLHMGKGLMTINPFHSDRLLMSYSAVAGILPVMFCGLDLKMTLHKKLHYLLYTLSVAIKPRMLVTVDEDGNNLQVDVRVGKAVDTVGQAGKKRSITGFQTHSSPVLLGAGERAELASEEYIPLTSVLEGVVILRKNLEWEKEQAEKAAKAARGGRKRTGSTARTAGAGAGAGAGSGSKK